MILHDAESQIINPNNFNRPLAKWTLVLMVRGAFSSLKFPYVQFLYQALEKQTFFLFQQVVSRLTRLWFHVLGDGASGNRKMFLLHDCGDRDKLVYKTTNVYSKVANSSSIEAFSCCWRPDTILVEFYCDTYGNY